MLRVDAVAQRPVTDPPTTAGGHARESLSADDAAILGLESDAIAGHTLKLMLLAPGGPPLDVDALRASVAERVVNAPRATQRIDMSGAGPAWVEDERFDISRHVRRLQGSTGTDEYALRDVASQLMSERLDHTRPLWTLDLVGPLADGREAIVARIHHAMADGVSCIRFLGAVLWDVDPAEHGPEPSRPKSGPAPTRRVTEVLHLPGALHRELGGRGGRSPFDRPIGSARALAFVVTPLAELKAIGHARPQRSTVNDVLLTIVAGGLRRWLLSGPGTLPRLRAQIPVSLHHRDDSQDALGNRDSFLNVDLCVGDADPLDRLARISAETARRKRLGDAEELFDLFHALGRFPHVAHAATRLAGDPREFSVSISNVPGPSGPVRVAGREVEHLYSAAEPAARHALRVSAISCAGTVGIGLCSDPGVLPGIGDLAAAVEESWVELRTAALGQAS